VIAVGRTYADLRAEVAPVVAEWCDAVLPRSVELLPHNRYAPAYAWMFSYEKRLKYRVEELAGRRLGPAEPLLFGPDGALSEALSNAFVHGHRRDLDLAIEVAVALGRCAVALSVRDRGPGFDVAATLERLARGAGHFAIAGNGLRTLSRRDEVIASFGDGGRSLHLAVRLWPAEGARLDKS
jgi:anti-sigma regulatory factor (Ser/Thr protein kinase)